MKAESARRSRNRLVISLLDVLGVVGCAALALATPALAEASEGSKAVPIVFVHGFAGSATQYASVAKANDSDAGANRGIVGQVVVLQRRR